MSPDEVERAVAALLALARRPAVDGATERAVVPRQLPSREQLRAVEQTGQDEPPVDLEALRLARDHGISELKLGAYQSLARSRGLGLDDVIRAAFRGALRAVVALPPVERRSCGAD